MPIADYAPYIFVLLSVWAVYVIAPRWITATRGGIADLKESIPPSLHPVIDPALCIGCGACIHACPEGKIIKLVGSKAELIDAASCIGHGACKTSCPVAAIDLVFGSAKRGIDIPQLSPDFQTSVPGIYVAGELGGMGLIANAIEQGSQAISAIAQRDDLRQDSLLDVVIIGAGPAGLSASLAARERRLSAVTLEQDRLGGTVAHYPRDKIVMTRPAHLPLYGEMSARRVKKETLLADWQAIVSETGVKIRDRQRVERIVSHPWGFEVETQQQKLATKTVLLATGRRGAPRKLGVSGEDLAKVTYSLSDPAQYAGKRVLVVGGGNAAVEAAVALARVGGIVVTLCHRGTSFERITKVNRDALATAEATQALTVLLAASVATIAASSIELDVGGTTRTMPNDAVLVCVGGQLPTALLRDVGIAVETKYGMR